MKTIPLIAAILLGATTINPQPINPTPWAYGTKGMTEISGNFSGWYEKAYSSKSVTALLYPELGYFFLERWYVSTGSAFEYFYTKYDNNPFEISNMNFRPNLGLGRVFSISSTIYLNLHSSVGSEYVYCFFPHCSSGWRNGLRINFSPTIKFVLKESVLLNLTWVLRGHLDWTTGNFFDYFRTMVTLGFSYAF
ncbi:hypothetical protein [Turneriella parva]|uniref:Uncharacterized protein n=1 Tax=Turneriella parva (strain ATCC BAA-1111 / DSM 21527 / NCTC 11395 / H) TaxID=869212 RepID=I4B9Z0_TURPD|nr:hypothetical protein [Turneriella parva]AFM14097.1 hypothetical protein Turpa_3460 [Turneriella parva DSM 21527]